MDQPNVVSPETDDGLSPYRSFTRDEWAKLRADAPMTLTADEVSSAHDRLVHKVTGAVGGELRG